MIVCFGLTPALQRVLVFERFRVGEVNRASQVHLWVGGKSINTARVVQRLGSPVVAITCAGGETGRWMEARLKDEGMRITPVPMEASNRVCISLVDEMAHGVTELVEDALPLEESTIQAARRAFEESLGEARIAVFSGTLPQGAPETLYADLARLAVKRSIPVIVDARGASLLGAVAEGPSVVKPNREELSSATGCACRTFEEMKVACAWLRERGARTIAVSLGAAGALAAIGDRFFHVRPPRIVPVNPIGSGDAMTAGIAHALCEGKEMLDCIRLGVACGTANASTLLQGDITVEAVERVLANVAVEEV